MNRNIFIILAAFVSLILFCCAPVLRKEIMDSSIRDISLAEIKSNPDLYRGKLFAFGGIIVDTKITTDGSLIEAIFVRVDSLGNLEGISSSDGRFLALFPKKDGLLDPVIFRSKREITLAGEFVGMRAGTIDGVEYLYPLFRIVDLYLWRERNNYYYVPPTAPYYWGAYPYWWYDYPYWRNRFPPPYWW